MQNRSSRRSARSFSPVEALESRRLFSGVSNATLLADGFQQITWHGQTAFAKADQWIAKVDNVHGKAAQQVAAVDKLVGAALKGAKALKNLGADGLTLVQTPKGLTQNQVTAALGHVAGLKYVEPDFAVTATSIPDDTYFGLDYGLNNTGQTINNSAGTPDADIDAPEAWDITRGDGTAVVGIIDTGVDYNHPDLQGAIWTNPGEIAGDGMDNDGDGYVDDVHGWDFFNNDSDPMDDAGHGTHVAGTIAATGNNGQGVAGVVNAKVMALKFLGADGSGSTSGAVAAINYATKLRQMGVNIRVTNNSWGSSAGSTALQDAITANGNAGELFITAAGNGGSDQVGDNNDTTANYPSNYTNANIVAVAATDNRDQLASFSNYGATSVDLSAPGVDIASTYASAKGGGYVYMSGTSMATPHVAGVAALAFSLAPNATAAQVKSALLNGVDKVSSLTGKTASGGRLNALHTLQLLSTPAAPSSLTATAAGSSSVTLAWSDNSTTETGFGVERSTDGGNTFSQVATTGANATGYTDTGLAASTAYVYRVRALGAASNSDYTAPATATTDVAPVAPVAPPVPAAPSALTAAAVSQTQIKLTWSDNSSDETGFKVERSTDGRTWSQVASTGANVNSYVNGGLKKRTTYYFRVRAYNAGGDSAYTAVASAKTLASGPNAVTAAAATEPVSVFSSTPLDSLTASDNTTPLLAELA